MRIAFVLIASLLLGGCELFGGAAREVPTSPGPERNRAAAGETPSEPEPRRTKAKVVPPNPELERSRDLIGQVAADATVNSQLKAELEQASTTLDQAFNIWNEERGKLDEDDEEWQEIRHLNYLARQRTAIVVMKARGLAAVRELSELQSGNKRVLARARRPQPAPAQTVPVTTELPQALQGLRPRQEPRGLILTLDDRFFGDDQRLVGNDALFDALLQYLVANPGKRVACEGHADTEAGASSGQHLSQQRARAVQDALLVRGLELSRITAVGYGSVRSQNGMPWSGNRRVEIVISDTSPIDYSAETP